MQENTVLCEELKRIIRVVNNGELNMMGKLFSTRSNNYFYDTGTGKVICLDDDSFFIMQNWFNSKHIDYEDFLSESDMFQSSLEELLNVIHSEFLLYAEKPKTLYNPEHFEKLDNNLESGMEQLIIELTGKCNLRCRYCIYNEQYDHARTFVAEDISKETAKKAIDYFFEHSTDEISVTYYGGEPLINFELLRWTIEYSLKLNTKYKKKLSFGLTTNLTLVTKEIAQFFASIPDLNVLCSLDGPEEIHNSYRITVDGTGSFDKALRGLKLLSKEFNKVNRHLSINSVFGPPFTYDKLEQIDNFFDSLDFLPKNTTFAISYPTTGSIKNENNWQEKMQSNPKYKDAFTGDINPLWEWRRKKILEGYNLEKGGQSIVTSDLDKMFNFIDNRIITSKPNHFYPLNACCVPGKRRLYVSVDGKYYPCERVGVCPDIGDVDHGIDKLKLKKYYVDEFIEKSIDKCSQCWAVKMCRLCYAGRYTEEGFNVNEPECEGTRLIIERTLSLYHELLEGDQNKLKSLESITVK